MKTINGIVNISTILTVVSLLCVLVFKIGKAIFFGVIALFKNLIDQDWRIILILIVAILLELGAMLLISKKLNRE